MSVHDAFAGALRSPTVEIRHPKPGVRHQKDDRLVFHRFPIKGGITIHEAMIWNLYQPTPLLKSLVVK